MQRVEIKAIKLREYLELSQELKDCERRGDKEGAASAALALNNIATDSEFPRLRDAAAKMIASYDKEIEDLVAAIILREHYGYTGYK